MSAEIASDCGSIWPAVNALIEAGIQVHAIRDLTRGGLATILNELTQTHRVKMCVEESRILVQEAVQGACDLLGLDPLYVANEGTFVAFVEQNDVSKALEILRKFRADAQAIGAVETGEGVIARSAFGSKRVLDMLSGEQLPRIC